MHATSHVLIINYLIIELTYFRKDVNYHVKKDF